jgi:pimeloyl-ACP methyl ester carboxylesterase
MAEQFCEVQEGVTLCYETFGSPSDPPLLLIMGLGTQMIAWPEVFCARLAQRGFYVIRFDNRDCGRSTRMRGRPPTVRELVARRIENPPYTLSDMAADAAGLMRGLGCGSAHVVGASMGGMIAQVLAVEHPALARSLTSIMASTGSRWRGQPALSTYRYLLRRAPTEREAFVAHMMEVFEAIGSRRLYRDRDRLRATAERSYERGVNPAGTGRQLGAILASGDRTAALRAVTAPTLVNHGPDDPMVNPTGARATVRAIPGAQLVMVPGMGHDLPDEAWPRLIETIADHARAAERVAAPGVRLPT